MCNVTVVFLRHSVYKIQLKSLLLASVTKSAGVLWSGAHAKSIANAKTNVCFQTLMICSCCEFPPRTSSVGEFRNDDGVEDEVLNCASCHTMCQKHEPFVHKMQCHCWRVHTQINYRIQWVTPRILTRLLSGMVVDAGYYSSASCQWRLFPMICYSWV